MDNERKDAINKYLLGVKTGDELSLDLLYEEISPTIRYIALKYLQNDFYADDLVQDFWADIYRIASGFRFSQNGFSYLCKVMTRRAINRYKSLYKTKINRVQRVEYENFRIAVEKEKDRELNLCVKYAMENLTETEYIIIQLTYFEGKTVRDIAKDLKISKSQVSKLKIRAVDRMKREFDENFVDKYRG